MKAWRRRVTCIGRDAEGRRVVLTAKKQRRILETSRDEKGVPNGYKVLGLLVANERTYQVNQRNALAAA